MLVRGLVEAGRGSGWAASRIPSVVGTLVRSTVAVGPVDTSDARKKAAKLIGWRTSIDSIDAGVRSSARSSLAGCWAGGDVAAGKAGAWARHDQASNQESNRVAMTIVSRLDRSIGRGSFRFVSMGTRRAIARS
jgi:hypothetical protein